MQVLCIKVTIFASVFMNDARKNQNKLFAVLTIIVTRQVDLLLERERERERERD